MTSGAIGNSGTLAEGGARIALYAAVASVIVGMLSHGAGVGSPGALEPMRHGGAPLSRRLNPVTASRTEPALGPPTSDGGTVITNSLPFCWHCTVDADAVGARVLAP